MYVFEANTLNLIACHFECNHAIKSGSSIWVESYVSITLFDMAYSTIFGTNCIKNTILDKEGLIF